LKYIFKYIIHNRFYWFISFLNLNNNLFTKDFQEKPEFFYNNSRYNLHFKKLLIIIYYRIKKGGMAVRKITKKSILSLIAVFVLVAAFSAGAAAQDFNDGEYVGYVPGDHGDIVIEVKVNFGEITGVEILNNLKTTQYPHEPAREYFINFPSAVIRNQGTEGIDAVSGATGSHNSYTEAVDMALSIARGNYDGNTYYGVSRDYAHGHYLVEAVIEEEEIKDVSIITAKNPEEEALVGPKKPGEYDYEPAVETFQKWADMVVENQSVNVDVVSGATHTDHGLNGALAQCLTQAGLNPDDYK